jgi:putative aminopeptidase FrvX
MERKKLLRLAESVLTLPTAPYHEHRVREFVTEYCRGLGLRVEWDRVGNVIARYRRGQRGPPLVFVAHMDHPGFEILDGRHAEFLGGVPKEVFVGAEVRVFGAGRTSRATVVHLDEAAWPHRKLVVLRSDHPLRRGEFGMWDVPMFRVRGGLLHATAIDDVLSVVVVLATLAEVARRKLKTHAWGVFTRAEEVGFHGAVEVARSRKIPKSALVISMEMSRERPWAKIGDGPVVRVGDRMTTFDTAATLVLQEVAEQCRRQDSTFHYQRCLMDGGSCEATAFAAFGYRAGGLCLPLGNYHNVGKNGKVRAEFVSVNDLEQLTNLTVAIAGAWKGFGETKNTLRSRVLQIRQSAPRVLKRE